MKHRPAILCTLLAVGSAAASDTELAHCRSIVPDTLRLACYDAMPLPLPPSAQIGFEAKRGSDVPAVESLATSIPGRFLGWEPRSLIKLANGQVWQVTDESTGVYRLQDPQAIIRRGTLGSFFLELPSVQRSIRVKRVE